MQLSQFGNHSIFRLATILDPNFMHLWCAPYTEPNTSAIALIITWYFSLTCGSSTMTCAGVFKRCVCLTLVHCEHAAFWLQNEWVPDLSLHWWRYKFNKILEDAQPRFNSISKIVIMLPWSFSKPHHRKRIFNVGGHIFHPDWYWHTDKTFEGLMNIETNGPFNHFQHMFVDKCTC